MQNKDLTYYDIQEERLNVMTHGLGLLLSVVAFVLLISKAIKIGEISHLLSFMVFGASLILLYSASTFYHYFQEPHIRRRLNILDHAAIYILIAGTYTPFTIHVLKGSLGWTIFGLTWGIALVGIVFKLFFTGKYDRISTIAYVAMGWIIIFAIKPLVAAMPPQGLRWVVAGGISYTIGAVLYSIDSIKYNHAIFHIFVLMGSFCHFMAVYYYIS
ncbi:MAG TPA: hemolysin III family protein [Saprospiraceae bacterium]|nr:hemolysin III family protein [Saprospiraceae bacterium]